MPGQGPTWINGLVTLRDDNGRERLLATYVKVEPPLTIYQRGLAEFNDQTGQFDKRVEFDMQSPLSPEGHPIKHQEGRFEYVYFANPFPLVRVRATPDHLCDLSQYEAYTCLKKGSRANSIEVERNGHGTFLRLENGHDPLHAEAASQLDQRRSYQTRRGSVSIDGRNGQTESRCTAARSIGTTTGNAGS